MYNMRDRKENNYKYIIDDISNNLQVYKYDLEQEAFILNSNKLDKSLHSLVFDDLKVIDTILKCHKINYRLDEDDYSITIEYMGNIVKDL